MSIITIKSGDHAGRRMHDLVALAKALIGPAEQELEALERLAREADQAGRDESGAAAEPPSDGTRSW